MLSFFSALDIFPERGRLFFLLPPPPQYPPNQGVFGKYFGRGPLKKYERSTFCSTPLPLSRKQRCVFVRRGCCHFFRTGKFFFVCFPPPIPTELRCFREKKMVESLPKNAIVRFFLATLTVVKKTSALGKTNDRTPCASSPQRSLRWLPRLACDGSARALGPACSTSLSGHSNTVATLPPHLVIWPPSNATLEGWRHIA